MTTASYPVVGQNIPHAQWRNIMQGFDGRFDSDADTAAREMLKLTLSATDNTATIGRGTERLNGFTLEVTAAHGLTLAPAVGTPVTYSIGIMYDPALESDAAGPLYLAAPVKTAITVPAGGKFRTLVEVTRQPTQVLSQAAVVAVPRFVGGSYYLPGGISATGGDFPVGAGAIDGLNGHQLIRVPNSAGTGTQWRDLDALAWVPFPAGTQYMGRSGPVLVAKRRGMVHLRGDIVRRDGSLLAPGNVERTLGTLAAEYRPEHVVMVNPATTFKDSANGGRLTVAPSGTVSVEFPADTTWSRIDCSYPVVN